MADKIRCAIYTRKSSEDGLEQEFNSLDAQHEACCAYVASQTIEGWALMPKKYDDGGISGGSLQRPALQELLADIKAGHIDRIVVYKIDRLTRSLNDFAKIVEVLDASGATFVSVTQSFNTATSMGRLTLNMLLSFAQFEREVTTERIRDKIKASKKKGMFMGGNVPMGYSVQDRHLHIAPKYSVLVKQLFNAYLTLGCLVKVQEWLVSENILTPTRIDKNGNPKGGRAFSYGHIHSIITNPIYIGKTKHYKDVYEGKHTGIIPMDLWNKVQQQLQQNSNIKRDKKFTKSGSCLMGIIYDETGDRLTPSGSKKIGVKHRYYVSNRITRGNAEQHPDTWRLPADILETFIQKTILSHISKSIWGMDLSELDTNRRKLSALYEQQNWANYITKIVVHNRKVNIQLSYKKISEHLDIDKSTCHIIAPFHMTRKAHGEKVILGLDSYDLDIPLLELYIKTRKWYQLLCKGHTILEIAEIESLSDSYIRRMIDMAFLDPNIVKDLSDGKHPIIMTKDWIKRNELPDCWAKQGKILNAR